jgi:hypothetical protein
MPAGLSVSSNATRQYGFIGGCPTNAAHVEGDYEPVADGIATAALASRRAMARRRSRALTSQYHRACGRSSQNVEHL